MTRILRRFAKTNLFALAVLVIGLAAETSFAQSVPDPKAEAVKLLPGAYYWTTMGWQAMEPLEWSANGVKRTGKSSVWIYRHSQAHVQLKETTPLFCYKLPDAVPGGPTPAFLQDFIIARLDQKKDRREFSTTSGQGAFAFRPGLNKERTREIAVTGVTSDVFFITPKEPLSPGEYVMGGPSLAITGYDFGIHSTE